MRTIKLSESGGLKKDCFTNHKFQIAIPSVFNDTKEIVQMIGPLLCRESIIHHFVQKVTRTPTFVKTLNKARVIITGFNENDIKPVRIKNTLNFIHRLEDAAGITPRTTASMVETPWKIQTSMVMFEGSSKWYRSTHTMSLWHLILRACSRDDGLASTKTDEEFFKYIEGWIAKIESNGIRWATEDQSHIKTTAEHWVNLMKNVDKIFPKQVSWVNRFSAGIVYSKQANGYAPSINRDGVRNFITGKSKHRSAKVFEQFKD